MNHVRAPRFFFFPHGRERRREEIPKTLSSKGPPWRVPTAVVGMRVSQTAAEEAEGIVMADGYRVRDGAPLLGGNQDPCIFSAPLGLLHVFCRVGRRKGVDNDVMLLGGAGSGALLANVVAPGDVVLYGKPDLGSMTVAVDTVIVVERTAGFEELMEEVGIDSDAFRFSLSDAAPLGSHAGENRQQTIIGRTNASWAAVESLSTSFVPLAAENVDRQREVLRVKLPTAADRTSLFDVFRDQMFGGTGTLANKGRLCELPPGPAEALVRAVVAQSGHSAGRAGTVFVPPLRPRGEVRRLGSDDVIRGQAEHLARLGEP